MFIYGSSVYIFFSISTCLFPFIAHQYYFLISTFYAHLWPINIIFASQYFYVHLYTFYFNFNMFMPIYDPSILFFKSIFLFSFTPFIYLIQAHFLLLDTINHHIKISVRLILPRSTTAFMWSTNYFSNS
jgi:hypothetical protein